MQIAKQKVKGMTMPIREEYGGEYFENSLSNDGALLASGVPATD